MAGMSKRDGEERLDDLRGSVEDVAQELIHWYDRKSRPRRAVSRLLRVVAVGLGILGGLCPLLGDVGGIDFGRFGYVLLALAGGLFVFDKLFGFSTSWMRFTTAEMELREELDAFRVDWLALESLGTGSASPEQPLKLYFELSRNFVRTAHGIARKETELWIKEFGSSLERIEKLAKPEP